jgi:circadian clock protein KaiC
MPITGAIISPLIDNIIVLRHVEIESTLRRSMVILKARSSANDSEIREFEITSKGVTVKGKFVGMEHVFEGKPRKSMQEKPPADRSKS